MRATNDKEDAKIIYDGSNNPDTTQFLVKNLTSNNLYSFFVIGRNFNGYGQKSDDSVFLACLKPSVIENPKYVRSTKTSIEI